MTGEVDYIVVEKTWRKIVVENIMWAVVSASCVLLGIIMLSRFADGAGMQSGDEFYFALQNATLSVKLIETTLLIFVGGSTLWLLSTLLATAHSVENLILDCIRGGK